MLSITFHLPSPLCQFPSSAPLSSPSLFSSSPFPLSPFSTPLLPFISSILLSSLPPPKSSWDICGSAGPVGSWCNPAVSVFQRDINSKIVTGGNSCGYFMQQSASPLSCHEVGNGILLQKWRVAFPTFSLNLNTACNCSVGHRPTEYTLDSDKKNAIIFCIAPRKIIRQNKNCNKTYKGMFFSICQK